MTVKKKKQTLLLKCPGSPPERVNLGEELKSGGAGSVYSIKDDPTRVIKLYHDTTLDSDGANYEEKIVRMLESVPHVPSHSSANETAVQLAWPTAAVYTLKERFVGFAMPTVDLNRTTELEFILSPKLAKKNGLAHHLGITVSLAYNLSAIVSSIHAKGYAIVDLKPVNLKYYIRELYIAVLDCDGFSIQLPGKPSSAPQVTPEYVAPEFQDRPITNPEFQDRFALAVIIFKLLNYGIHPYAGVAKKGVQAPTDIEQKIKSGLYPYGITPHSKVIPVLASTHQTFPDELRVMFDRAFGGAKSSRPSADEWSQALRKFAEKSRGLLARCANQHLHFKGMPCGECLREQSIRHAMQELIGASNELHYVDDEPDELYDQAVEIVLTTGRPSISLVQRSLSCGYNRAARLIEAMEAAGLVTPVQHDGSRSVVFGARQKWQRATRSIASSKVSSSGLVGSAQQQTLGRPMSLASSAAPSATTPSTGLVDFLMLYWLPDSETFIFIRILVMIYTIYAAWGIAWFWVTWVVVSAVTYKYNQAYIYQVLNHGYIYRVLNAMLVGLSWMTVLYFVVYLMFYL